MKVKTVIAWISNCDLVDQSFESLLNLIFSSAALYCCLFESKVLSFLCLMVLNDQSLFRMNIEMLNSCLSESSRAARLTSKFQKTLFPGSAQKTWIYEEIPSDVKDFFATEVVLSDGEIPVLAFFQDRGTWLFATTRRIVWRIEEIRSELFHEQIAGYGWSSGPLGSESREKSNCLDVTIYTKDGQKPCKQYSPWLSVIDCQGVRREIFLESGSPLCAVWNSLKLISRGFAGE